MNQLQLTPIVTRLLIINIVLYVVLQIALRVDQTATLTFYVQYLALGKINLLQYPSEGFSTEFNPIQLVGSFFTHSIADIGHILFNCIGLIVLGPMTERVLGPKRFLRFYLFCGVVGALLVTLFDPSQVPVVGASGAIMGVATAFAFYFPTERLSFLFIPISFTARQFIIGLTAISAIFVLLDLTGNDIGGNISHFGHLCGTVAAVLYFQIERFLPNGR